MELLEIGKIVRCHGVKGRVKAVSYLEDVVKNQPDSVVAWQSLASVYRKDRDARIKVYERGLKANPAIKAVFGQ